MKRIVRQRTDLDAASPEAAVRRWQVKWTVHGEAFLAAAHERAAPKPVARGGHSGPRATVGIWAHIDRQVREAQKLMHLINIPELGAWRKLEEDARRASEMFETVRPLLLDLEEARKQVEQFEKQRREVELWS